MNKNNKEIKEQILEIIKGKLSSLNCTEEDKSLIHELVSAYYRRRIGISNSAQDIMSAAFLWVYSKSNFLWERDKKWSKKCLAELFGANPKTTGDVTTKIMKALDIRYWDERFCRESVQKGSPFNDFVMTKSGFIVSKEMLGLPSKQFDKKEKNKEYYFEEAINYLEKNEEEKAIISLNSALSLDNKYIEALNELGLIYFDKNLKISKEYYEKAVELSKAELGGKWPDELRWAISENRPYLRAVQGLSLVFWRNDELVRAKELFSLLLKINPNDNQGIRYCMAATYNGLNWEQFGKIEDACTRKRDYTELDNLLEKQNKTFNFWKVSNYDE